MTQFQTQRINTSGPDSQTEQPADESRKPRVIGTYDENGITVDFRSAPGYSNTALTTEEVKNR